MWTEGNVASQPRLRLTWSQLVNEGDDCVECLSMTSHLFHCELKWIFEHVQKGTRHLDSEELELALSGSSK
jgi:hypothetical protein